MNEAHEIGVGSAASRAHVVEGLVRIVGGSAALFAADAAFRPGGRGRSSWGLHTVPRTTFFAALTPY
jgi:hypothetical protein